MYSKKKQEVLGTKQNKLLQDVETMWNTTLDIVSCVQAPICAALLQQKRMDLLPKDEEFKLLQEICSSLETI